MPPNNLVIPGEYINPESPVWRTTYINMRLVKKVARVVEFGMLTVKLPDYGRRGDHGWSDRLEKLVLVSLNCEK